MKFILSTQSIRGKLLLLAVAIELIVLTIQLSNSLRLFDNAMVTQAHRHAQHFHHIISLALTTPMADRDYVTVQTIITNSRSAGDVSYIAVLDASGSRIASSGWPQDLNLPNPSVDEEMERELPARYDARVPLALDDQVIGSVYFGIDILSEIIAARNNLFLQSVGIAVIMVVLSSILLIFLGYRMTRHLGALREASIQVTAGKLMPPPVPEGKDDLGKLGAAFNTMSRTIAERVRELTTAKEAAETSESRLSSITNHASDAIIMMDSQGEVSFWNPAAEKIFGYRFGEVLGKPFHEVIAPERHLATYATAFPEFARTERRDSVGKLIELSARRKDGREIQIAMTLSGVFLSGERYAVGILRDVTEIKRQQAEMQQAWHAAEASEKAKAESEERLQLVLDGSNDGFWDWDIPTGKVNFSPRSAEMIGYSVEEMEPNVNFWNTRIHPKDKPRTREAMTLHLEGHIPLYEVEHRLKTKSGEWKWIFSRGKVVKRDTDGNPLRVTGTNTDISSRKAVEESLKRNEEQIRLLLNSTAEAIYGTDLQGRCTFVNRSCLKLLGYNQETKIVGKIMHGLIHHSDINGTPIPPEECGICQARLTGTGIHRDDDVLWRADGTSFDAEYWSYPQSVGDKITGTVVTFYDITDRKQTEKQLKQMNEDMVASLTQLQIRNQEIAMLGEMSIFFQACKTLKEFSEAMASVLPKFFLPIAGAFYVKDPVSGLMEPIVSWGCPELEQFVFNPEDCWGLRLGKAHIADNSSFSVKCAHTKYFEDRSHLCIPLTSGGDVAGVLHLQHSGLISENMLQLAKASADSIILSLTNLKLRESLHEQSVRDPLTGLYNRRFMEETLNREIMRAHRSQRPMCILMVDIDHFKRYNDTYGHEVGDTVLKEVSRMLQARIRTGDVACRFGGEEFTIILAEAPLEVATKRAERLREGCEQLIVRHAAETIDQITISIGVSGMPDHGSSVEDLFKAADNALYQAKREGRNRVVVAAGNTLT